MTVQRRDPIILQEACKIAYTKAQKAGCIECKMFGRGTSSGRCCTTVEENLCDLKAELIEIQKQELR
jgi:hypothetical protein